MLKLLFRYGLRFYDVFGSDVSERRIKAVSADVLEIIMTQKDYPMRARSVYRRLGGPV